MEIRQLTLEDHVAQFRLGAEAFGSPPYPATVPEPPAELPAGRTVWGSFDDEGELLARVAAHDYESWWHGRRVRTCGIAGVTVAPEARGAGLLRPLFEKALAAATARGDVLSTLFPTANGIYRSLGYEVVTSLDTVELATADLLAVRPPERVRTRRARIDDLAAVRATYDAWAAAQNGPLTRTGPRFPATDEELLGSVTAVSLAVDADDAVLGYAIWDRGEGYDPATSVLEVHDLVAVRADGYRALWRMLGSHTSVAGRVRLSTSGHDPARLVLPTASWHVVGRHPYMLRVADVAGAVEAAGLVAPEPIVFALSGDRLGADGCVVVDPDGCRPAASVPAPTYTPQGLALAFAGVQSSANLRMLDHLTGPTDHDTDLDRLFGGRPVHVRDYF